jgi:hypothetical protein
MVACFRQSRQSPNRPLAGARPFREWSYALANLLTSRQPRTRQTNCASQFAAPTTSRPVAETLKQTESLFAEHHEPFFNSIGHLETTRHVRSRADGSHQVMHGEWQVGQITKPPSFNGTAPRWIWALNGAPSRRSHCVLVCLKYFWKYFGSGGGWFFWIGIM